MQEKKIRRKHKWGGGRKETRNIRIQQNYKDLRMFQLIFTD